VLWKWKNSERKEQVREEEEVDGEAESQTSARRVVLKGAGLTPHLRSGDHCVSETFAHARAPRRNNHPLSRRLGSHGLQTCRVCAQS
jgi:hypothetical protein